MFWANGLPGSFYIAIWRLAGSPLTRAAGNKVLSFPGHDTATSKTTDDQIGILKVGLTATNPRKINLDQYHLLLFPNAATEKSRKLRSLGVIRRSGVYRICKGDAGTTYWLSNLTRVPFRSASSTNSSGCRITPSPATAAASSGFPWLMVNLLVIGTSIRPSGPSKHQFERPSE